MSDFITPPLLRGTEQQQLTQLRDYLFQLHRQLTHAVNAVENGEFSAAGTEKLAETAAKISGVDQTAISQSAASLKSLIVKTADVVQREVDQIETELHSKYVAQSDFGIYQESINTTFTETAEAVTQQINYAAEVAAAANAATNNALNEYIVDTQGFIRQGIIGYRGGTPIIGIAIGQDIQTNGTATANGRVFPVIDTSSAMSTFSAERLSFYLNGVEVAYVSNSQLYITEANVTEKLVVGDWEINHASGFTVKWIGA